MENRFEQMASNSQSEHQLKQFKSKHNHIKRQAIKDLWNSSVKKKAILDKVVYDLGQQGIKDVYIKVMFLFLRKKFCLFFLMKL